MQGQTRPRRWRGAAPLGALVALMTGVLSCESAGAQALTVLPVSVRLAPGQDATTLTVINQGAAQTSVQVRAFAWRQPGGADVLSASDDLRASPPIATIAPGATQLVRLVRHRQAGTREVTYRILLDQIPPPADPGTVRIALRLSIPVFAEPPTRALAHVGYRVERDAGAAFLLAVNDGDRHETLRDIALTTRSGASLRMAANASPYILAGATRRWRIDATADLPSPGEVVRVTAKGETGAVDQSAPVVAGP